MQAWMTNDSIKQMENCSRPRQVQKQIPFELVRTFLTWTDVMKNSLIESLITIAFNK